MFVEEAPRRTPWILTQPPVCNRQAQTDESRSPQGGWPRLWRASENR